MKLLGDKKKKNKIVTWKRILNEVYVSEEESYTLPAPQDKDYNKLIKAIYNYEIDAENFIKLSNLDNNELIKKLDIPSQDLKKGLQFLTRNGLVRDPLEIVKCNHEMGYGTDAIPITLTAKGFDVARENEKHKVSIRLSTLSVFFTIGYLFFTIVIAFYYSIQLMINANMIDASSGAVTYLAIIMMVIVGIRWLNPTMTKFMENL